MPDKLSWTFTVELPLARVREEYDQMQEDEPFEQTFEEYVAERRVVEASDITDAIRGIYSALEVTRVFPAVSAVSSTWPGTTFTYTQSTGASV